MVKLNKGLFFLEILKKEYIERYDKMVLRDLVRRKIDAVCVELWFKKEVLYILVKRGEEDCDNIYKKINKYEDILSWILNGKKKIFSIGDCTELEIDNFIKFIQEQVMSNEDIKLDFNINDYKKFKERYLDSKKTIYTIYREIISY